MRLTTGCLRKRQVVEVFNDGMIKIYTLQDTAEPGDMPKERLVYRSEHFFAERYIGITRYYAARQYMALGPAEQIDKLVRIWQDKGIRTDMYAVLEDGEQYRITLVQHTVDDDGLGVSDLTLTRVGELYEIA